jgi:hypothetical protein
MTKPVGWLNPNEESDGYAFSFKQQGVFTVPLYTAPPKKEWVGLTDEEARELCVANVPYVIDMARALSKPS